MTNTKKKSPINASALRYPGQSLTEEIQDIAYDNIFTNFSMATMLIAITGYQWYERISDKPPIPEVWTFITIVFVGYASVKFYYAKNEIKNRKLGRDGERVVGQFLETLRGDDYHVFHDLKDENFNVDHVIIGPAGAFTIETKTWSKPSKGQAIIDYDGENISMNGFAPEKNPIIQARAQKDWLQKLILKTTGKKISVRPVVVYPGWFIRTKKSDSDVWVLEPKALPKYLKNEKKVFDNKEADEIAFQISRHIRSNEEKNKQ
jgi:hypothetical protein